MKTNVEINSLVKAAVNRKLVRKTAIAVIDGETKGLSDGRNIEVSIVIAGPKKIREINKKYRKKDQVTDVLSFAGEDSGQDCGCPRTLGELVICAKQVKDDAREAGVSAEYELAWVVAHGMLHLFGYDHEASGAAAKLMREKEQFYLSQIKLF
jgi:probable rRNA maturation factor